MQMLKKKKPKKNPQDIGGYLSGQVVFHYVSLLKAQNCGFH